MSFDRTPFYDDLVDHLVERAEVVKSLAVMVAFERWVQMEAAYLLDVQRDRYGLGGGDPRRPDWWITCEHRTVDIWAEDNVGGGAVAIELKALHNNKNFYGRIASVRGDLMADRKPFDRADGLVERVGMCVVTYARYEETSLFSHLPQSRGGEPMEQSVFLDEFDRALKDEGQWYAGAAPLVPTKMREIVSLEDAHYIEPGHGSAVWLGLVEAKKD